MVPVMNKPVMTYSIELLKRYGIDRIGVTLQYLPQVIQDYFGDGKDLGVSLKYFIEETPLGTAGSVKNAQDFLDETFVVISGDALTDIDLKKAIDFHVQNHSIATLVLKRVEVPLEYGVVVTNERGEITRFLEKPNWGEVFSDTVNTGIYILEPEVLDYFEKNKKFDFSQDLFPMLLKDKKPMFGYITDEYWCDIGNPQSYLQAHFDMMDGKVRFSIDGREVKKGVWVSETSEIHPDAFLEGPCYVGKYSRISKAAYIGPYSVVGDYCEIGEESSTKRSILWNFSHLGKKVELRGATICSKVEIGSNSSLFEGSVVGEGSRISEYCTIKPDVKIWPGKVIDCRTMVKSNVVWDTRLSRSLFGKDGVAGLLNGEISPQLVHRMGAAFGADLKPGSRIAVSCDENNSCKMLKYSMISGLLSVGSEVFDLGELTTPILRYAVRYFAFDGGIHIFADQEDRNKVRIHFVDRYGANLSPATERRIENLFIRDDFQRMAADRIQGVHVLRDVPIFYMRNLMNGIHHEAIRERKVRLLLSASGKLMSSVLMPILKDLGCICEWVEEGELSSCLRSGRYDLACKIDKNGENLVIFNETGNPVERERLWVLITSMLLKSRCGEEVVVPYTAPDIIEQLAQAYNGVVIRTRSSRQAVMEEIIKREGCDGFSGKGMFSVYSDGAVALVKLIEAISVEEKSLSELLEDLPKFHMKEKAIDCPWSAKGRVMRSLIEGENKGGNRVELFEGVKILSDKGWALILPDSDDPVCRIYSQGFSEEYASELVDFYAEKISNMVQTEQ